MKRTPLTRKRRMKRVNRARRARLFAKHFHSDAFVAWVHSLACTAPGCYRTDIHAAHVKGRAVGGTWESIIPLCAVHHAALHAYGRPLAEAEWGHDLDLVADAIQLRWAAWTADKASMLSRVDP